MRSVRKGLMRSIAAFVLGCVLLASTGAVQAELSPTVDNSVDKSSTKITGYFMTTYACTEFDDLEPVYDETVKVFYSNPVNDYVEFCIREAEWLANERGQAVYETCDQSICTLKPAVTNKFERSYDNRSYTWVPDEGAEGGSNDNRHMVIDGDCARSTEFVVTVELYYSDHVWDKGVVTKEPTGTEDGIRTYSCAGCRETKTEIIPKLDVPHLCPGAAFTDMPAYGDWAHDPIDWAVTNGVTNGTSAITFEPEKTCTRGQIVTFLWRAAGKPAPKSESCPFTDVKSSDYFYDAVLWAVEKGITNGTSATTFEPDSNCTRGQIVTFLWRAKGEPKPTSTSHSFTDMKTGEYYYNAVLWAVETGVTNGTTKTTFGPDESCTRAQSVAFLYRAFH